MWRESASAGKPSVPNSGGRKLEAWSQVSTKGLDPPGFVTLTEFDDARLEGRAVSTVYRPQGALYRMLRILRHCVPADDFIHFDRLCQTRFRESASDQV
jgi:hypothetical protein